MSTRERLATPGGVLALIRLAAIPLFFAAERLVDHPATNSGPFGTLLTVAAIYAFATFVAELRGRPPARPGVLAAADLTVIAALVATSGGPFSQLRYAFFVLPVGAGLLLRPALTAGLSLACVIAYGVIAVSFPDADSVRDDAVGFEFTQVMFLAWMGAAATALSALLTRRSGEVAALAVSRGRLVAQTLDAEDGARRRLAEALHDEALQNLLAARQMLDDEDPESRALVREGLDAGVGQIRQAVFDLHPYLLEQAGLRSALRAVAEQAGRRARFEVEVEVDPAAEGVQDQLLFSIGRELIANVAKHSGAGQLRVKVDRDDGLVRMIITDDGQGISPDAISAAPVAGHIGLASCVERAEAVGGRLRIRPGAAGGTRAEVELPGRGSAAAVARPS